MLPIAFLTHQCHYYSIYNRCEVSSLEKTDSATENGMSAEPKIMYDLFGTVNHKGSMQSGHYVANVKVDDVWYHCNDTHITRAGPGDGESAVLKSDGAYMLFYLLEAIFIR